VSRSPVRHSFLSQWLQCHDVRLSLEYEHLPLVVLARKRSTEILFGTGANVDGEQSGPLPTTVVSNKLLC